MKRILWFFMTTCLALNILVAENKAPDRKKLEKLADQLQVIVQLGGDHLQYASQALETLNRVYGIEVQTPDRRRRNSRDNRDVDLFSLISGGLAIRESLQLDRITAANTQGKGVAISSLKAPIIKSHPFGEMVKGRKWHAFDLSRMAPNDFYYFHFNNMKQALDLFDYANEVGGSVYQRFTASAVDFHLQAKILNQLALKVNPETRSFYDNVIDEMAIVGSDPFLMEGTDITIIYKLKSPTVFKWTIAGYRKHFAQEFQAESQTLTIRNLKVDYLATKDRKIHSFYALLPNKTVVISNSKKALEIVLDTYLGKRKSLYHEDDFRYMRSIYQASNQSEDAFLYLSEAFIRYLVGPELRLKEARRMAHSIRMADFERQIILYYQVFGKLPASSDEIFTAFKVEAPELYADITPAQDGFYANSADYGRIGHFTPNIETELVEVSAKEAQAYQEFVQSYESYWRTYFDPIGVRVKMGQKMKIETCILPLINNSIYDQVTAIFGGKPVKLTSGGLPGEIFSFGLKFDKIKAEMAAGGILREINMMLQEELKSKSFNLADLVGDELEFHALDTRPMVDFDSGPLFREMTRGRGRINDEIGIFFMIYSLFHPLRASLAVSDELKAENFFQHLDRYIAAKILEMQKSYSWREFQMDHYCFYYKKHKIRTVKFSFFHMLHFRVFYTLFKGKLHVTSTQDYMQLLLDTPERPEQSDIEGNIKMVFRPQQMKWERSTYENTVAENAKNASQSNFGTIKLMTMLFPQDKDPVGRCLKEFGFKPISQAGGQYKIENDVVYDTAFGSSVLPIFDLDKLRIATGMQRFFDTREMVVALRFTPEGIMTLIEIE